MRACEICGGKRGQTQTKDGIIAHNDCRKRLSPSYLKLWKEMKDRS